MLAGRYGRTETLESSMRLATAWDVAARGKAGRATEIECAMGGSGHVRRS
jgi:hypothetical protein